MLIRMLFQQISLCRIPKGLLLRCGHSKRACSSSQAEDEARNSRHFNIPLSLPLDFVLAVQNTVYAEELEFHFASDNTDDLSNGPLGQRAEMISDADLKPLTSFLCSEAVGEVVLQRPK